MKLLFKEKKTGNSKGIRKVIKGLCWEKTQPCRWRFVLFCFFFHCAIQCYVGSKSGICCSTIKVFPHLKGFVLVVPTNLGINVTKSERHLVLSQFGWSCSLESKRSPNFGLCFSGIGITISPSLRFMHQLGITLLLLSQ